MVASSWVYIFRGKLDRLNCIFSKLEVPSGRVTSELAFLKATTCTTDSGLFMPIEEQSVHLCSRGMGLINEAKIPVQKLDGQSVEGAYFRREFIFRRIRYLIFGHICGEPE